jgi:hypothetical protein
VLAVDVPEITTSALDFVDWSGTWFSVKVSETGKAGPVVPPGGNVVTNNETTATAYLLVDTWEVTTATYDVVYCTFNGSVWTRHTGLIWPVFGEPENFLTFFFFSTEEPEGNEQTFVIPLNVTGKEKPRDGEKTTSPYLRPKKRRCNSWRRSTATFALVEWYCPRLS